MSRPPLCEMESSSEKQTLDLGNRLGSLLREGDVVCLRGELGTGKTVLAKGIAAGLGIEDSVISPTFTLLREYRGRLDLYHLDLYRVAQADLYELGLEEVVNVRGACLIEWPERLISYPPEYLEAFLGYLDENRRKVVISGAGERGKELAKEWCDVCSSH